MASPPIIPFALWQSGTNQNSVPANDNALRAEILQRNVNNATTAQPGSPSDGDTYIIQSTHTGAQWSTFTPKDLAIYKGGTWYAFAPVEGVKITVGGAVYVYTSGAWTAAGGGGGSGDVVGPSGAVANNLVVFDGTTGKLVKDGGKRTPLIIPVACSDETTALTAGTSKVTFRLPCAMTLTAVRASLTTAQASGSIFTVDINEGGTTVLSTKITIDNTEKTSTTAATAPVISDSNLADDSEITIDIDQIGDGTAKGLKVYLIGTAA